ncbi:hypothetical protein [Romboutsia weinsteinii]|nr:hypothetical protein [Romboutsia weinsteinii]
MFDFTLIVCPHSTDIYIKYKFLFNVYRLYYEKWPRMELTF